MAKIKSAKLLKWLKKKKNRHLDASVQAFDTAEEDFLNAKALAFDEVIAHVEKMKLKGGETDEDTTSD
jgi:hypothetical protein